MDAAQNGPRLRNTERRCHDDIPWRCRKVKDLDYKIIANGHGPVLRHNLEELVGRYKSWSESVGKAAASVAVLYSSDYGFSDRSVMGPPGKVGLQILYAPMLQGWSNMHFFELRSIGAACIRLSSGYRRDDQYVTT